jgi:hypothetical protein
VPQIERRLSLAVRSSIALKDSGCEFTRSVDWLRALLATSVVVVVAFKNARPKLISSNRLSVSASYSALGASVSEVVVVLVAAVSAANSALGGWAIKAVVVVVSSVVVARVGMAFNILRPFVIASNRLPDTLGGLVQGTSVSEVVVVVVVAGVSAAHWALGAAVSEAVAVVVVVVSGVGVAGVAVAFNILRPLMIASNRLPDTIGGLVQGASVSEAVVVGVVAGVSAAHWALGAAVSEAVVVVISSVVVARVGVAFNILRPFVIASNRLPDTLGGLAQGASVSEAVVVVVAGVRAALNRVRADTLMFLSSSSVSAAYWARGGWTTKAVVVVVAAVGAASNGPLVSATR